MSDRSEQQELLNDVLAESSPPDFRAALLGETLRLARRRRRWQQSWHVAGVLGALLLAFWLAWQNWPEKISAARPAVAVRPAKSYQLVETRSLPADTLVATRKFAETTIISSQATVAQITTSSGCFRFINDAQLLALAAPKPAILVRTGPDTEELVFAGPSDLSKGRSGN